MAKRKRKPNKRPRLKMTDAEAKKSIEQNKLHCIKESCEQHAYQVALSPGWFKECDCGRRWDFTDNKGRRITREEYDARVTALTKRLGIGVQSRAMERTEEPRNEGTIRVMVEKSKKAKKEATKAEKTVKKAKKTKATGDLSEMSKGDLVALATEKNLPHAKVFNRTELIAGLTNLKKWDKIAEAGPLARIAAQGSKKAGSKKSAEKSSKKKSTKKSKKSKKSESVKVTAE